MEHNPLDKKQMADLREEASSLWDDFIDASEDKWSSTDLIYPYGELADDDMLKGDRDGLIEATTGRNMCVRAFYHYCCERKFGQGGQFSDLYLYQDDFDPREHAGGSCHPLAWLWHLAPSRACLTLDLPFLVDQYEGARLSFDVIHRKSTIIILHEIGHLWRHWRSLHEDDVIAPAATSIQEAEAWLFAFAVYGHALQVDAYRVHEDAAMVGHFDYTEMWRWA